MYVLLNANYHLKFVSIYFLIKMGHALLCFLYIKYIYNILIWYIIFYSIYLM